MARGIAKLWKPVINVTDLDEAERFWSAVSGLKPVARIHSGTFSILEDEDSANLDDDHHWILLQQVPEGQVTAHSGTHLDFRVDDVALAQAQIEEIGGTAVKPAGMFPNDEEAVLEWAVMQDPFGNEFCIIRWPLE